MKKKKNKKEKEVLKIRLTNEPMCGIKGVAFETFIIETDEQSKEFGYPIGTWMWKTTKGEIKKYFQNNSKK